MACLIPHVPPDSLPPSLLTQTHTHTHQYAAKFLKDHIDQMESENKRLKKDLGDVIRVTEDCMRMKELLEKQNKELEREKQVRHEIHKVRLEAIRKSDRKKSVVCRDDEYPLE